MKGQLTGGCRDQLGHVQDSLPFDHGLDYQSTARDEILEIALMSFLYRGPKDKGIQHISESS